MAQWHFRAQRSPRRILIASTEFGVEEGGAYRPGGIGQVSRCATRALAGAGLERVGAFALVDGDRAMRTTLVDYLRPVARADVLARGFSGNRLRFARELFTVSAFGFDLVLYFHIGIARLGPFMPKPHGLLMHGIEVRHRLSWFERLAVAEATPLLSVSSFSSQQMQSHNPELPGARVVHLCAEPESAWSGGIAHEMPAPPPVASRKRAVLIVGRIVASERYKGHDQLIEAWPTILEGCPDAELWIVGEGSDKARLEAKAKAIHPKGRERIKFLGALSHDELERCYRESRVFAMPSLGEGFGLVFVEAMRWGLPCICSRDSAAEIVVDGQTGYVVEQTPSELGRACLKLLLDDGLASKMGSAGAKRYESQFQFESFRARFLEALGLPLD